MVQKPSPIRQSSIGHVLSWLRSIFVFAPLIYLYTIVLGVVSLVASLFERDGRVQHKLARLWSRMILRTAMSPVTVSGLEHLSGGKAAVYAVNHGSALDIPAVYGYLPGQFRIMAKKELFRYPFVGWHLKRSGQISIDRDDARASMRSLNRAADGLRAGMPLLVFPEGGRTTDGHIQPFMGGAFYAAIRAGVDVVPMALIGTYEVLPMNTYHIHPGPIRLVIGEPISSSGYSVRESDKLAERVRQVIAMMYYEDAALVAPGAPPSSGEVCEPSSN
jgi:1-acyl-sn-glycerol-3-phosphate acyltransferase